MKKETEEWRPIVGYEGLYEVSNLGRVKSLPKKNSPNTNILAQRSDREGYKMVNIHKDKKGKTFRVHRLVMVAFDGYSPLQVDHINGNKSDNTYSNLEYVTGAENTRRHYKKALPTGLSYHKKSGKYEVSVSTKGNRYYLGLCESIEGGVMLRESFIRDFESSSGGVIQ